MVDLIERVGPFLGIVAFLGLAVLAFGIFQQARDVRRLREWAGRAPERKAEADDAVAAASEARGDKLEEPEEPAEPEEPGEPEEVERDRGAIETRWQGVRDAVAIRFAALDRRLPVDPRYLLAVLAAVVVAAAVLTSGFGLGGGDGGGGTGADGKKAGGTEEKEIKVEVAVLNATQESTSTGEIAGVPGLAGLIADEVVKPAGYKPGEKDNAASGFAETTVFFESGSEEEADELAAAVSEQLGETAASPMIPEVRELAGDAELALVVGQDNAEFAGP